MLQTRVCAAGRWLLGLTAMQKAGEGVYSKCVGRGAACRDEGGWKRNRTALTTEPKDKEKIGLADRKAAWGV